LDLLELHHGAWIVALQREVSLLVTVLWIVPIERRFAVDFDDNVVALGDHFLRKPFVRLVRGLVHDRNLILILAQAARRVEASGPDRIGVRGVNLRLVALREVRPEGGTEVLAAVAFVVDHRLDTVAEVLVIAALAEEMAVWATADQEAVLHVPQRHLL